MPVPVGIPASANRRVSTEWRPIFAHTLQEVYLVWSSADEPRTIHTGRGAGAALLEMDGIP